MPREFRDFDAAADAKEPLRFRVAGEEHELPADIPAHLVFEIRRRAKQVRSDEEAEDFGMELIERLMSAERWERITRKVGIDTAQKLIEWVMEQYGFGASEEEQGDPKAEAPEATPSPSSTSSSTGETSNGTTNVFGLRPPGDQSSPTREAPRASGQ